MLDYAGLVLTFFISIMQVKDPPQVRMCRKDCGLPCRLSGKEYACNAGDVRLISGLERSLEEGRQPTSVFLPGESRGQRSLAGYNPWGCKKSNMTEAT